MASHLTDSWFNCYSQGWGRNRLRPASFAHPAKAAYALTARIYEHALEKGWIAPGQTVLDPFAGIGGFALEAMRHGLNFVGVELEQRFCDMGQGCDCTGISKADWVRFQGRWDKARYKDGRHWCPECIMKAGAVAGEREFKPMPLPGTKWAVIAKMRQATLFDAVPTASYVRNSGRIPCTEAHRYHGNIETWEAQGMPGTAVIVQGDSRRLGEVLERARLCLSSPPFADTRQTKDKDFLDDWCQSHGRNPNSPCRVASIENYGSNPQNLGNLPDTGFELALSSPPYAGSLGDGKSGIDWSKQADRETAHPHGWDGEGYGRETGQLAAMPDTGFKAALAISSPVYIGNTASDDPDKRGGLYRDPKRRNDKTLTATYSKDEAQLAQMPEGDLALAIGSPPYAGSIGTGSKDGEHTGMTHRETPGGGFGQSLKAMSGVGYGQEEGQLAILPEGDHAEACERPTCAISSPPFLGSLNDGLRESDREKYAEFARAGRGVGTDYGDEEGQLGQMPTGNYAAALEAGAETGRAQCAISSPPFSQPGMQPISSRKELGGQGVRSDYRALGLKPEDNYGNTAGQLGQQQGSTFWAASREILEEVYKMLAPGGHCIFVCKRFVRDKKIVEFSTQWARLCEAVGFKWIHHHKAWLVEDRGAQHTLEGGLEKRVVKRFSFFRRIHAQNFPHLAIEWEDVLCFQKPL